jgi:hypothetical protein
VGHVAALPVRDHEKPGAARGLGGLAQRPPAGRSEPLEARELELDRDARRSGRVDQGATVKRDRSRRALGGRALRRGGGVDRVGQQARRIGVEPERDLASALADDRREAVGEVRRPSRS